MTDAPTPVTRFDHSGCEHEKTKTARAKCRKAMREAEGTPKDPAKKTTAKPAAPAKKSPTRATPAKKSPTKPTGDAAE
ncbi:hypothetical protein ACWZEH_26220 [Streptomyces sp. QTS137]